MTAVQLTSSNGADKKAENLRKRLENRTLTDKDFWSFRSLRNRTGNHALFQYPAMMVPELQGALLDDVQAVDEDICMIYDPFSGSGTVLLESLYRGLDFHGSDINPLAILLCEVKAHPPRVEDALTAIEEISARASAIETENVSFKFIDKWFKPEIKRGLSKLRASIIEHPNQSIRKFLWICLAETIRLTSNSRISTFKLHTYTQADILRRENDALKVFRSVAKQNTDHLKKHWQRMPVQKIGDSSPHATLYAGSVAHLPPNPRLADVLMTSPPYGDNKTTVPYGQHSYLALCWIDHRDLNDSFSPTMLETTSKIDTMSLGGSLRDADLSMDELSKLSGSLKTFIASVSEAGHLRKKVLSFCRDYKNSLNTASSQVKPGGFCFFTLGERRVGKKVFPLVGITKEFLIAGNHEIVTTIERILPASRKRMAAKNSEGTTMAKEWILVTRYRGRNDV
jgi:site-specific DNA-methyltransferase (cytosine-N4-specific)